MQSLVFKLGFFVAYRNFYAELYSAHLLKFPHKNYGFCTFIAVFRSIFVQSHFNGYFLLTKEVYNSYAGL